MIACISGFLGCRCWRLASAWLVGRQTVAAAEVFRAVTTFVAAFAVVVLCATGSLLGLVLWICVTGLGFLGYLGWRQLSGWLHSISGSGLQARDAAIIAGAGIAIVFAAVVLLAGLSLDPNTPEKIADVLRLGRAQNVIDIVALGVGLGILLGWRRYWTSDRAASPIRITKEAADTASAVIGFIFVLAGLVLWAIAAQDARTPGEIADALQHGRVARFLLGLTLGVGVAFVMAERSFFQSSHEDGGKPAAAPKGSLADTASGNPSDGLKDGHPTLWLTSMAFGIVVLALASPHLDDWLRRLTGFKSPYVELQLASSGAHKIAVEEGADVLFSTDSLSYLAVYDTKIQQDIDYLKNYEQEVPKRNEIVASASRLLPTFTTVIGPIAKCVQVAIDHDWLSLDSARQMLRPTADALERIIFAEKNLTDSHELTASNVQFWQLVMELPSVVASSVREPECIGVPATQFTDGPAGAPDLFPEIKDYQNVPYLHVAAALLITFMGDNDKALRILQTAEPKLDFKDYYFLQLKGRLSYYNGKPGDIRQTYLGPLDEMRSMARSHIDTLEKKSQECKSPDITIPICRELYAELQAKNYIAYFIAEDLARGSDYVGPYIARLLEYGEDMRRIIDEPVSNSTRHKGFYQILGQGLYKRYLPIRYALLDTYAYAMLVVEARKPNPDYELIRTKVIPKLRETSDTLKSLYENEAKIERTRLYWVRVGEVHLESAREFVGE
jgi:hypothetical protein